jgi:Mce-associated membrane protein
VVEDVEDSDAEAGANGDAPIDHEASADLSDAGHRRFHLKWRTSPVRLALAVGAVAVLALSALVGWQGYRALQSHHAEQQRALFLRVARQGAINLSTISYTEVDADVRRILDLSTGTFHDDFQQRSQPFVDLVKRDQSKTEGSITEAGLQSLTDNSARVLLSLAVKTTTAAEPKPQVKLFRVRVDVQRVGGDLKVSNVEFIP